MADVQIQLRVVTPLFMGGAEPRELGGTPAEVRAEPRGTPAEVRALGVRGALRWWLRAALGGGGWAGPAFTETKDLWAAESQVFGAADSEHSAASSVMIWINDVKGTPQPILKERPTQPGVRANGRDYLLYGMHATRIAGQDQPARYYYPPGSIFTLCLRPRLGADNAAHALERACAALWLLVMLGGLGARTRHGAGCLAVVAPATNWPKTLPDLPVVGTLDSPRALLNMLQQGLAQIRALFQKDPIPSQAASPFTVLHPEYCHVFVLDKQWRGSPQNPTWQLAMDAVGQSISGFRQRDGLVDSRAVADYLTARTKDPIQVARAALGLPLPFFFPQLDGKRGVKAVVNWYKAEDPSAKEQRAASPLLVHFAQLKDGSLALVLVVLYQQLIPPNKSNTLLGGGNHIEIRGGPQNTPVATLTVDGYADLIGRLQDVVEADLNAPFRLARY